jgi:hypothetical protein
VTAARPLQNRVDPFGALRAAPERGRLMGNRGGRFHDDEQRIGRRQWASRQWIACVCEFKTRRREVFGRGYTELFFRDEPTALAAGHRPCFECRRAEALAFQAAFPGVKPSAPAMDARLHEERLDAARRTRAVALDKLPDGAMVLWRGAAHLKAGDKLWPWSFAAYGAPEAAPRAEVAALTPPSILAALAAGYRPRAEGTPLAERDAPEGEVKSGARRRA